MGYPQTAGTAGNHPFPQQATFDNYEVVHDFATIGRRIMLLKRPADSKSAGEGADHPPGYRGHHQGVER